MTLADLVERAHEDGIDSVLGEGTPIGLDRDGLEQLLIYCAERRCERDDAACPGCRLWNQRAGIRTLDDLCRRHASIAAQDTGLTISGGEGPGREVTSLDELARTYAGEEYWFWARRVLRKVRYGLRRSDELFDPDFAEVNGPAIILMEPQIAENVGMVARAMANFGLDELRVVNPRDGWPSEKARAVASGAAAIVDGAGVHTSLQEAIADLNYVVATTARQRDMRKRVLTPEEAAAEMRSRIDQGQRCGILYGRERNGLETAEVADCDAVVMIPVNAKFASLNLAQAVLLNGYAWLRSGEVGTLGRKTRNDRRISPGLHLGHDVPARHEEIEGFFRHLEEELDRQGFFTPAERRPVTTRNIRSLFLRAGLTAQEVRTLRGIVATLTRRRPKGAGSST
ncbi:MAG: RNA methyltransferase [Hyphomicrobiaceae bacterium]